MQTLLHVLGLTNASDETMTRYARRAPDPVLRIASVVFSVALTGLVIYFPLKLLHAYDAQQAALDLKLTAITSATKLLEESSRELRSQQALSSQAINAIQQRSEAWVGVEQLSRKTASKVDDLAAKESKGAQTIAAYGAQITELQMAVKSIGPSSGILVLRKRCTVDTAASAGGQMLQSNGKPQPIKFESRDGLAPIAAWYTVYSASQSFRPQSLSVDTTGTGRSAEITATFEGKDTLGLIIDVYGLFAPPKVQQ